MKKTLKIAKIVANVLLWLFLIFAVLLTVLVFSSQKDENGISSIGGVTPIQVLSDSMKGTFNKGDLIFVKLLQDSEKTDLGVGDVITYRIMAKDLPGLVEAGMDPNTEVLNTHRITAVEGKDTGSVKYTTKGDNAATNFANDPNPVSFADVVGVYQMRAPGMGSFIAYLQTPTGFLVCIVLPLAVFFILELVLFIRQLMIRREEKIRLTASGASVDEEEIRRLAVEEYLRRQEEDKNKTENTSDKTDDKE